MSFLLNVTAIDGFGLKAGLQDSSVASNTNSDASLEAAFRSTSSNYGIFSDGNFAVDTELALTTGLFLITSELNMDMETMTTWLNPTDLTNVAATATSTVTATASGTWVDMTSFVLGSGNGEAVGIDEIRIGRSLSDVAPIPEPGTFALIAGFVSLGALLLRRRRM